ncbi:sulfatase family protein [Leekyejoonella antrihumi]|uniref:sulfatase family protein n=1 Tax=Leekyejoonella antrihumi TaxID=1660198 RepID=UPI0016455B8F|nr:sulfatase [Leekyejoonella antrihumi]
MSRPNLLVVLADQFRASALGCLGQDPTHTPALDRLAAEARVLTNAVSTHPVCSPARAMMMTGLYPSLNGVPLNVNSSRVEEGVGLRTDVRCWSDVLADEGYRLGYIGKWHLTPPTADDELYGEGRRDDGKVWDAWTPPQERHGFDFWHSHGCCDQHLEPHYWTTDAPRESPLQVRQWSAEHETDVAIDYLKAADVNDRPFALMLSLNPPHQPFDELPEGYLPRYADRTPEELLRRPNVDLTSETGREAAQIAAKYFAAVTAIDDQIGRLLHELDELGLADDTIVVFTSDHGMQLGSHDLMYKGVPFEESIRVPFLVRWPGHVAPGSDDLLLSLVDVSPTLLGLLGVVDQIPDEVQGTDCSAALLGEPDAPRPAAALYHGPPYAPGDPDVRGLRTHTHKVVVGFRQGQALDVRLFDLRSDPYEMSDVSADQSESRTQLLTALADALEAIEDPWPGLELLRNAG